MSERLHVLIVEDNPADADLMRDALPETGHIRFHSESVPRLSEALARLATGGIDLVMTDLGLPDSQGLATFRKLRQAAPDLAIIVLTGNDDQEMAVAAVREGAQDFLVKGQISGDMLVRAVRYAIERKQAEEALRRAHAELDAARARYFDLYDLAPVGYVTVSEQGLILEANLTAVTLLGVARGDLVKQPLSRFILKEDQDIYYLHRKQLFETCEPQAYELRMLRKDGPAFWAHLETTAAEDNDGEAVCRVVLSDITEMKKAHEALQIAFDQIKTLRGILPICANCKKIRDDQGYWKQVEVYVSAHTEAEFTHGICPECTEKLYPGFERRQRDRRGAPENEGDVQ